MLQVTDLRAKYGRLTALDGISINVEKGEIVCVIGPNGAGKSTTFGAIAGGLSQITGSIKFEGTELIGLRSEEIARLGVSLVPEGRRIFATLSVEENLRLGTFMRANRETVADDLARVMTQFPALAERRHYPAGRLSGGEQQMLAIGRALMTHPKLMLIDEPSLGLAPRLVDQVYEILTELRRQGGITLLINEQSSRRVLKHADRVYVLRSGKIRLHDRAQNLSDGAAIKNAYFGFGEGGRPSPAGAAA